MKFSEGILDNLKNANQAMANVQSELSKVLEKKEIMEVRLPDIQETVEKTGQDKKGAFDRFLIDQETERVVDDTQQKHDEALRSKERTEEILKALTSKEQELNAELHKVRERQAHTETIVWNEISSQIMAQISKEISDKIYWAYAVNSRKRSSMPWEVFLQSLFARPDMEILKAYGPKLNKLFQEAIGRPKS